MKIVLFALAVTALWGQESRLSVSDPAWNGLEVRFLTKLEPPGENAQARLPGAIITGQGRAHHLIDDAAHKRTFGYDLWVTTEAGGTTVQLRISPMKFANGKPYSVQPGWTLIELPKYPVIPKVKIGETVALDLLVNPGTGQKIVDYLTVARQSVRPEESASHDFTLADVELSLLRPRVLVNGKEVASTTVGMTGQVVWLYLPGHGRFSLSLFPNEKRGFSKNGTAAADAFTFRQDSTGYRVDCSGPVAPGSARYNLYVRREPAWYPGPEDTFLIIGSNDLNSELTIEKH
jgi:hypothetical protein